MTELETLVMQVALETAPAAQRSLVADLVTAPEPERVRAAAALTAAGCGPAAHLMATLLPTASARTSRAFRDAIAALLPALLTGRGAGDALHVQTLLWLLNHERPDVHRRALETLAAQAVSGEDAFDAKNFATGVDRLRCVAYVVAARVCASGRLIIVQAFLKSAAPSAVEAGLRLLAAEPAAGQLRFALDKLGAVGALAVLRLLEVIAAHGRDQLPSSLTWAAQSTETATRQAAAEILSRDCRPSELAILRRLCDDPQPRVRMTALGGLLTPSRAEALGRIGGALSDPSKEVRRVVLGLVEERGLLELLDPVARVAARDAESPIRRLALDVLARLAPGRLDEWLAALLDDPDGSVADAVVRKLAASAATFDLARFALQRLPKAVGVAAPKLLRLAWEREPARRRELAAVSLRARSPGVREALADLVGGSADAERRPVLERLARDRTPQVRSAAEARLQQAFPEERIERAVAALRDPSPRVRVDAVTALAADAAPWLLEELLPRARDPDATVRAAALRALAKFDDPRVFCELVSSLNDTESEVVDFADELLKGACGPLPVLTRFPLGPDGEPPWVAIRRRVEAVNRWAARVGAELLGRSVIVHQYRQGLGRTWNKKRHESAHIEVSDTPVTSGHPHGEEIMKGLALHEIGHHIFDIGTRGNLAMRGVARSEGVNEIYDILRDERLERGLRARRPEWGVYFDRLASYAFAQDLNRISIAAYAGVLGRSPDEVIEALRTGALPGRLAAARREAHPPEVILRESEMLQIPGLVPPLVAFLSCLRCGFDPYMCPDVRIAQAIGLVPANLKDLPHGPLLDVARRIAALLGRSPQHKQALEALRRRLRQARGSFRALQRVLDRLANMTHLPDWATDEGEGIRAHSTSSAPPGAATRRAPARGRAGQFTNRGRECGFERLSREERLAYDPVAHGRLTAPIRKHIRRLRTYLERLGTREVEHYASRRGRRVDLAAARKSPILPRPNLLVWAEEQRHPDAYIGILIDRSGSMSGQKIELAKSFGALVAESAAGLPGIDGHVSAFDGSTFYHLGPFRRNAIAALTADDGNNDAGGLSRAAELALSSRKRRRLIVMISDGAPTECTFESLKRLVEKLSREDGILCAQVAVQPLADVAFPHYLDLSGRTLDAAVAQFGRLLAKLTAGWR